MTGADAGWFIEGYSRPDLRNLPCSHLLLPSIGGNGQGGPGSCLTGPPWFLGDWFRRTGRLEGLCRRRQAVDRLNHGAPRAAEVKPLEAVAARAEGIAVVDCDPGLIADE